MVVVFRRSKYLINVAHVSVKIGILQKLLLRAFEKDVVCEIEPDQSSEEANISKSKHIPTKVPAFA